jgi:transcription antitermination factor NusB
MAREIALEITYQLDLRGREVMEELESYLSERTQKEDIKNFSRELVLGVYQRQSELDKIIVKISRNWEMSRMAVIDRNILRIAVYELVFRTDIPPKSSINEAIDIAKKYGSKDSGSFVNGILNMVFAKYRKDGNNIAGSKTSQGTF